MPETTAAAPARERFGATARTDAWGVEPLLTFLVLSAFVVYSTYRAFEGTLYEFHNYLSPFFSPLLFGEPPHAWLGAKPSWLPLSPAFLVLWAPAGFRLTCYYYRKAYYRSFAAHPIACAVSEGSRGYCGETRFPLIFQNLHRFFLYAALLLLLFLWSDVVKAFRFEVPGPAPSHRFGIGVGSLVILASTGLLTYYTFSCHSLRHLVGGRLDRFSGCPLGEARYRAWSIVTRLNERHMLWAWLSLFAVGFADVYVRLLATKAITDLRIL